MKQNPSITRENLANKLDVSIATLKRELTSLRKKGYISRRGSNKKWAMDNTQESVRYNKYPPTYLPE